MADRMAAEIWIGGKLPRGLLDEFPISDLRLDWDETPFDATSEEGILNARDESGRPHFADGEAAWGESRSWKAGCGSTTSRSRGGRPGKYEYLPELVEFRPDLGEDVQTNATDSGEPLVCKSELAPILEKMAKLRQSDRPLERTGAGLETIGRQTRRASAAHAAALAAFRDCGRVDRQTRRPNGERRIAVADNYLQFSEVVANLTTPEEEWLKEQLQPIRVFADKEYPEDAVPAELADTDADWTGVRFLRDNTDHDPDWDVLGFEYNFHDDHDKGGWGRHLWVYAEESGCPENVAWLVQKFLKKFRPDQCWSLTYSTICSKPRVANLAAGRCLSRPTHPLGKCLRLHRNSADGIPAKRGGLRLRMGRPSHVLFRVQFDPATLHVSDIEPASNQEEPNAVGR